MSRTIMKEKKNLSGQVYMVGDDPDDFASSFAQEYRLRYGSTPKLIETLGFEALTIAQNILAGQNISNREDLERELFKNKTITGVTGSWNLKDNVWIKEMDVLNVGRTKIQKADLIKKDENSEG